MNVAKLMNILAELDPEAELVFGPPRGATYSVTDVTHGIVRLTPVTCTPVIVDGATSLAEIPNTKPDAEYREAIVLRQRGAS